MIIRERRVQLSPVLVPYPVFAVLSTGDNEVVTWVPVTTKDYSVMSFPLDLLISRNGRQNDQVLVGAIEDLVILWAPAHAINWLVALNQGRSEHTSLGPDLDLAILSRGGQSSSFVAPSN